MTRKRWHILREDGELTLTRQVPARLDVGVTTFLPLVRAVPLAHQIRQDIWRALRGLRGFSPIVHVARRADGLKVTAGGRVDGPLPYLAIEARLIEVLNDSRNRARWVRWAR